MGEYKTPGVYIKEKNAFGSSVVEVETAVPAFIGYTEKALNGTEDLTGKAWKITSMAEFIQYFGGMRVPKYTIAAVADGAVFHPHVKAGSSSLFAVASLARSALYSATAGAICVFAISTIVFASMVTVLQ